MQFFIKYRRICLIILLISAEPLVADQCPTPEKIKERKISRDYDWTIDERRTLEDVLSVEKLYSVRIKNKAEYIACYYSGSKGLLRLDGKPLKQPCRVSDISGRWQLTENGEQVCKEEDLGLCKYDIKCGEINAINE
jgi:hypothetical protein